MKFLTSPDFTNQQLLNVRFQQLAADPSSPAEGWVYWNTASHTLKVYTGSAWVAFSAGTGTVTSVTAGDGTITIGGTATDPTVKVAKALDHTWVTDFDTQVRTSRLDQMAAPTAAVACGSQRFTSAADPTSAQDLATKNYVDLASQGFDFKASVRVVATTNGTLATAYANGSTVDGVSLVTGNRILLAGQTTASENGIYVVAASGAPTRAADADASGEISPGAFIPVEAGTLGANSVYYCTATGATPWVPNSSTSTWSRFSSLTDLVAGNGLNKTGSTLNVVPGNGILADGTSTRADPAVVVRKFAQDIGNGSLTSIAVTHSLGTKDITWSVRQNSDDSFVQCDCVATSTTVATLTFAVAPTTNQYRVVIHG
jgi:hypothetical protein